MANTPSAKKAARKIERRTIVNRSRRTRLRTFVRKVEEAIASGNHEAAAAALKVAEPVIVRAAQNGIIHRNTAARKVSRLAHRVRSLAQA
jgi:small subunit ribosomal protein S20